MDRATQILIVGATPDSDALAELLRLEGYKVAQAARSELVVAASAYRPRLVIADVAFPQTEGLELLHQLQAIERKPRTILVSSRPSAALEPLGVTCLGKPVDLPVLWRLLNCADAA